MRAAHPASTSRGVGAARLIYAAVLLATLSACGGNVVTGPAGQPTGSSVNPETGTRGGNR